MSIGKSVVVSVLTVYFSRTGFTRSIAEEIGARCGGSIERIEDVRGRSGVFGYIRSAREALKKSAIEIRAGKLRPVDFDVVVVGTPVWAGHVSSPVRAYLTAHRHELKQVAFFCTLGGSGAGNVLAEMEALCGRHPVATVAVRDADIQQARYGAALDEFVAAVVRSRSAPSAVANGVGAGR